MDRVKARALRKFLADTRDEIGDTDDTVLVEYYAGRPLPRDVTLGDMIDLLECWLEPFET